MLLFQQYWFVDISSASVTVEIFVLQILPNIEYVLCSFSFFEKNHINLIVLYGNIKSVMTLIVVLHLYMYFVKTLITIDSLVFHFTCEVIWKLLDIQLSSDTKQKMLKAYWSHQTKMEVHHPFCRLAIQLNHKWLILFPFSKARNLVDKCCIFQKVVLFLAGWEVYRTDQVNDD